MPFKEMLKQLRQKAGMTQEQLAAKADLPLGNVRNYEQGIRQPGWPAVVKLAKALGVSTDVFAECDEVQADEPAPAPKKRRGGKRK